MSGMAQQAVRSAWVVVPQVQALRETVYGVKTHYTHAGEGDPLVLVHGGGPGVSGGHAWEHNIPVLAERFHVYALDLIGNGYTDKPLIEYSFQTLVSHVAGFIDALNLSEVRLAGYSQGAYVAIKYTLEFPARVRQVVLGGTGTLAKAVGLSDGGRSVKLPGFDGTKESLRRFLEVNHGDPSEINSLLETRYRVAALPGHREYHASIARYNSILNRDASEQQVFEVRQRLAKLTVPWCLVWGEQDRSAPVDPLGYGLHELYPKAPFHVVKGSGHAVHHDKPEEYNRLALDFFGATAIVRH